VWVGGGGIVDPPLRPLHPSPGGGRRIFPPSPAGVRSGLPAGQRVGPPFEVKWYCSCELLPSETNPWDHYNPVSGQAASSSVWGCRGDVPLMLFSFVPILSRSDLKVWCSISRVIYLNFSYTLRSFHLLASYSHPIAARKPRRSSTEGCGEGFQDSPFS